MFEPIWKRGKISNLKYIYFLAMGQVYINLEGSYQILPTAGSKTDFVIQIKYTI